jgi:hypothetical protein
MMKKKIFVVLAALVLLLSAAAVAGAQVRLDVDINDPIYFGYSASGVQQGVWNNYPYIPIPDVKLMYQFPLGPINVGAGVRVFSLIVENFLYPELYGELDLGKLTVNASIGGLEFLMFGLLTSVVSEAIGGATLSGYQPIVLTDLSVAYKLNDIFRLSGGALMVSPFQGGAGGIFDAFAIAGYVKATFVVEFK